MIDFVYTKLREIFGPDALDWLDSSYITDWVIAATFWGLSGLVSHSPIFLREFSLDDPVISHPHRPNQIGGILNHIVALYVPMAIVALTGIFRRSLIVVHHGILAVWAACGLTRLITEFLKHNIGRLRPDFLARCEWSDTLNACTGKSADIADGRKSFPSGHTSWAFAGMTFLSLWLACHTSAWCFHLSLPRSSLRATRLGRFALTLLPLYWAMFVAITRIQDYRHHKEDVIAGALIGIFSSTLCYLIFWPSPFSAAQHADCARLLYTDRQDGRSRNAAFELVGVDDEIETV